MLSRLILMAVQLAAGWYGGLALAPYLPDFGKLNLFLAAAVVVAIVWLVGAIMSLVLKDLARPSFETLIFSLAVAVIAIIATVLPDVERAIVNAVGPVPSLAYPLIGAVVGYAIQR